MVHTPCLCLIHHIVPACTPEEVVTIVQSGRALRLFHEKTEQARVRDEAWKTWRTTIANNVITALKALQDSKTRCAIDLCGG